MTNEQREAFERASREFHEREWQGCPDSCHRVNFKIGMEAAQSPEMLILNPLVKEIFAVFDISGILKCPHEFYNADDYLVCYNCKCDEHQIAAAEAWHLALEPFKTAMEDNDEHS